MNVYKKIDKAIEAKYAYAFDERFGYLTACPTNVGTGFTSICNVTFTSLDYI